MPQLRIVIVSWNVKDLVTQCVGSIIRQTRGLDYEIIVVDNASEDGTPAALQRLKDLHSQVHVVLNNKNRGFAVGCNQGVNVELGMRNAEVWQYTLLLNPDTEIRGNGIKEMIDWMETHPKAGIAGCQLRNLDGSIQPSVRRFPTAWSQLLIALKAPHWSKNMKVLRDYYQQDFNYTKEHCVDQVMGAFFLVRRECWDQLSGLDERFFIWFEEVDFCLRAKHGGWETWYVPIGGVVHNAHASFRKQSLIVKQWNFFSSMVKYFWKHRHE